MDGDFTEPFVSDWMKKKLEARRDVMQKIIKYYFGDHLVESMQGLNLGTPSGPARTPSPVDTGPASTSVPSALRAHAMTDKPTLFMNNAIDSDYGGGREHYVYSSDDTMSKVHNYLSKWQRKNLNNILNVL